MNHTDLIQPATPNATAAPILAPRTQAAVSVMQVAWSFAAGGSEQYALTLGIGLDRSRFTPSLCAFDHTGPLQAELDAYHIPNISLARKPGFRLGTIRELYRLFRDRHIKIVHTHHFGPLFYSAIPARLCGARIIHTEHGLSTYTTRRHRLALRLLSHLCDAVVAVGSDAHAFLRDTVHISDRKLHIIPGGVRTHDFTFPHASARRALGFSPDDRLAIIVARLSPEKNHALLLDAFAEVRRQLPRAHLLIVGDGPERSAIEARIAALDLGGCTHLLGVRRDIPQLLAACDVFLLASTREALPIAVIEAMAAGLPVVATRVGDVPMAVLDTVTGHLVPSGDAHAFALATARLLSDPQTAALMGTRARAHAAQFDVRAMIDAYQQLYTAAASRDLPQELARD